MVEFTLPFPPTVNTYWRNVAIGGKPRVLISKKGREYASTIEALCVDYRASFPSERLCVSVHLFPPDRRRRDVDNYIKTLFDALTKAGVWGDDEQVDVLHVYRREATKGGAATVTISPTSKD